MWHRCIPMNRLSWKRLCKSPVAGAGLNQNDKARGSIQQAQIALDRLPPDADFAEATSLNVTNGECCWRI